MPVFSKTQKLKMHMALDIAVRFGFIMACFLHKDIKMYEPGICNPKIYAIRNFFMDSGQQGVQVLLAAENSVMLK